MSSDGVVSRLLAAIGERETVAREAEPDSALWRRFSSARWDEHIVKWQPNAVLRLCQSHRDIVARHSPVTIQVYDPEKYGHTKPSDFADEQACARCGTPSEYPVAWPCADLIDLARGYGVEDGEAT